MVERLHTYETTISGQDGVSYRVHAEGEQNALGTWYGWLAFEPQSGVGPTLRTSRETTQPNREDLEYWASGIEPVYFEGALERATVSDSP